MFIYTAVASLSPLELTSRGIKPLNRKKTALPPDLLSGGGREILASYTSLTFSGNFQDIARRLIDTLPSAQREHGEQEGKNQLIRYECGEYFFNQLVHNNGLVFVCIDSSLSDGDQVFDYLECIRETVLSALQHSALAAPTTDTIKRTVSLAFIEGLNNWMSLRSANFSSVQPLRPQSSNNLSISLTTSQRKCNNHVISNSPFCGSIISELTEAIQQSFVGSSQTSMSIQSLPRPATSPSTMHRSQSEYIPTHHLLSSDPYYSSRELHQSPVHFKHTQSHGNFHIGDQSKRPLPAPPLKAAPHPQAIYPNSTKTHLSGPPQNRSEEIQERRIYSKPLPAPPSPRLEAPVPGLHESAMYIRSRVCYTAPDMRSLGNDETSFRDTVDYSGGCQWNSPFRSVPTLAATSPSRLGIYQKEDHRPASFDLRKLDSHSHAALFENEVLSRSMQLHTQHSMEYAKTSSNGNFAHYNESRVSSVAEERLRRRRSEIANEKDKSEGAGKNFPPGGNGFQSPERSPLHYNRRFVYKENLNLHAESENAKESVKKRGDIGILLPLDYSGMVDGLSEGDLLLKEVDIAARNDIRDQVNTSTSLDDILGIIIEFRDCLCSVILPRPAVVDVKQALVDAQREVITVNGKSHSGSTDELMCSINSLVSPLVYNSMLTDEVCNDIIRASSRTASGGDTYSAIISLLAMPEAGYLLTPSGEQSTPIDINVDADIGEVVITVHNDFLLRKGDFMDGMGGEAGQDLSTSKSFRKRLKEKAIETKYKITKQKLKTNKTGLDVHDEEDDDTSESIILHGRMEVYLSLPDGACKRRLGITSPLVERAPPQCIALGAGSPAANGTFDLSGWRNGSPVYFNYASRVTILKAEYCGSLSWSIRKLPNHIYYICLEESSHPPDLHWTVCNGNIGTEPPPTLMVSYQKRAKEKQVDIRHMPTPRWQPSSNGTPGPDFGLTEAFHLDFNPHERLPIDSSSPILRPDRLSSNHTSPEFPPRKFSEVSYSDKLIDFDSPLK